VFPNTCDIDAGASISFRVAFRPTESNFYSAQRLECYVYHKSNRSFRLVNDAVFTPPLRLQTLATGHTFAPGFDHFLPIAAFSAKRLTFPSVHVTSRVCLSVSIGKCGCKK
jgi:hypothetical protein